MNMRAVFLDRDGMTNNVDIGYVGSREVII
jgi:hypothetical protein